jgi:hypothetical protein
VADVVPLLKFSLGLQTTGLEDGLELPRFQTWQNLRVDQGAAKRRPGQALMAVSLNRNKSLDLNGSSQYVTIPLLAAVHTLKRIWTFEALVQADSFATNAKTVLGVAHASDYSLLVYFTTAGNLVAKVQDSGATVTTLTSSTAFSTGTTYAIQIVRDGTSLTMRVNGASEATGSIADLDCKLPGGNLYIGRDNGGLYFDGKIDFVRIRTVALADQSYGLMRLPDGRAIDVLMDYVAQTEVITALFYDRSRFELHGTITASPPVYASALGVQTSPCTALTTWFGPDNRARLFACFGLDVSLNTLEK